MTILPLAGAVPASLSPMTTTPSSPHLELVDSPEETPPAPADRGADAPNTDAPNTDAPNTDAPNTDAPKDGADTGPDAMVPGGDGGDGAAGPVPDTDAGSGIFDQLWSFLDLGGPVLFLLLVLSVTALAIILAKFMQLVRTRAGDASLIDGAITLWRGGRRAEAQARLRDSRTPVAHVVRTAMSSLEGAGGDEAVAREETTRVAMAELKSLNAHLRGLEIIAVVSPLLGLLGTVLGMIEAFRQLQGAGTRADPSILAGGIWEALLTTAVGLAIAVPATLALSAFESRIGRLRHAMEDAATRVFTSKIRRADEAPERAAAE